MRFPTLSLMRENYFGSSGGQLVANAIIGRLCLTIMSERISVRKVTGNFSSGEEVTPHGPWAERKNLQPSPRGRDGERPRARQGNSATGPARFFASLRMTEGARGRWAATQGRPYEDNYR